MSERASVTLMLALSALIAGACTATVSGELDPDGDGPGGPIGEDPDYDDPGTNPLCDGDFENVRLDPVPPTVQLLIDMSGSMTRGFGNMSRWDAVRYALTDATDGVVSQLGGRIHFGATLYHSINGSAGGACAQMSSTAPAMGNLLAIRSLLDEGQPDADTPTAEAVDSIAATLTPAAPNSRRFVVLATDGDPDTCDDPDAHDLNSKVLTENAVDRAWARGISTLVLSVGNDITREHLRRTANLGVGEPVYSGDAPYYLANNPVQLVTELEALLMETLPTCSFTFPQTLDMADAPAAELELDGDAITYGTDWRWVDEHTIELIGAMCDEVMDDPTLRLTGQFVCEDDA